MPDAKAQGQTWWPGKPKNATMPAPSNAMKVCSTVSERKRSALLLTITFQPAWSRAAKRTVVKTIAVKMTRFYTRTILTAP